MPLPVAKSFHLPWQQYDHYWIGLRRKSGDMPLPLVQALQAKGFAMAGSIIGIRAGRKWGQIWDDVYPLIQPFQGDMDAAVIQNAETLPTDLSTVEWKTPAAIQQIAESLWLGEALIENRLLCYLQPVMNGRDQTFGYESFARVKDVDGGIIGGDKIITASRALGIEFVIDRYLHTQAVSTFANSQFNGFLFVNLFPGFIQKPDVYLEGLSAAVKNLGVVSKHVVLEFTRAEQTRDTMQLKKICEYGRSRGYSIALDDVHTLEGAKKLIALIQPDFLKIDHQLVRQVDEKKKLITDMVILAHAAGCAVIAEGVETQAIYDALKAINVDLFQGYYFSSPMPVEAAMTRAKAGGL